MPLNTEKKSDLFEFSEEQTLKIEEMMLNQRVVEVIQDLMKMNNIHTKKKLAELTGFSTAYISKVFRSEKNFNVRFLVTLERVFNTTFSFSAKSIDKILLKTPLMSLEFTKNTCSTPYIQNGFISYNEKFKINIFDSASNHIESIRKSAHNPHSFGLESFPIKNNIRKHNNLIQEKY